MSTSAGRILFVGHTYITNVAQKKLDVLSQHGIAIGLLAPSNWVFKDGLFSGQTQPLESAYDSFKIYPAPVMRSGHIASHLYFPGAIFKALISFHPDIVQVEQEVYSYTAAQVALAAKLLGKKVVVFGYENLDRKLHFTQYPCRWITIALADLIICGSSDGAELVRKWGYTGQVEIMPELGVDMQLYSPRPRPSGDIFTIGYVGRMVFEKGGDLLLRAFSLLTYTGLKSRMVFAGSGPERSAWQALAVELGIAENITWLDGVSNERVPEIMATIDLLVLPSRSIPQWKEQFGMVLIEAMAMGIPVVGARSGAIPEVIGREDVIFPEEDYQTLSQILENLLLKPEWRKELSEFNKNRVKMLFTNEILAQKLMTLYKELF